MDTNSYFNKWSEKLSISLADIETEFNKTLDIEKNKNPEASLEVQEQSALKTLALKYKKMLRSPAVGFEGIIIGSSDCVDIVAKQRREATELYRSDPQTAIEQGATDEEGNPLDSRRTWSSGKENYNFGKPLPEHSYIKNVYGVGLKSNSNGSPKFFSLTVNGEAAENENLPMFKPVRFMAIDKTPQDNTESLVLNASSFTRFEEDATLNLGKVDEIIKTSCKNKLVGLTDLQNYHAQVKDDFNRLAIIVGDVSQINREPTAFGSRIINVEDLDNLEDIDTKGLTCWIPERVNLDFDEGSKVILVGRTQQSKKKDELGNITEELGDISMNVYGLYALPEHKVSLAENLSTEN